MDDSPHGRLSPPPEEDGARDGGGGGGSGEGEAANDVTVFFLREDYHVTRHDVDTLYVASWTLSVINVSRRDKHLYCS